MSQKCFLFVLWSPIQMIFSSHFFCFSAWHHLRKLEKIIESPLPSLSSYYLTTTTNTPCTEWMCRFIIMRLCVCVCVVCVRGFQLFLGILKRWKKIFLWYTTHTHTHTHPVKFVDPLFTLYIDRKEKNSQSFFRTTKNPFVPIFFPFCFQKQQAPHHFSCADLEMCFALLFSLCFFLSFFFFVTDWPTKVYLRVCVCVSRKFRKFSIFIPTLFNLSLFLFWRSDDTPDRLLYLFWMVILYIHWREMWIRVVLFFIPLQSNQI